MNQERKYFADNNGRLNADDDPIAVGENEWVNAENIRTGSSDNGQLKVVEYVGGTKLISAALPSVTFIKIGSVEDLPNKRFINFLFNTTGLNHKITCIYTDTDVEYDVLLSSQVDGGLNFDKDYPIHSARVLNGLLYWTDNTNEPKKINIDKALMANNPSLNLGVTAYSLPMVYPTQTLIKRPPYYPLQVSKQTDAGYANNFINDNAYQMAYYYGFVDNEQSRLSAYSELVPYGDTTPNAENYVSIKVPFDEKIDDDVQIVYICIKYMADGTIGWVKAFDKNDATDAAAIAAHNAGTTQLSYNFYDDTTVNFLDSTFANTPYDSVPLKSEGFEIAVNRAFLSNNVLGYDTPTKTSLGVTIGSTNTAGAANYAGDWKYMTLTYYANSDPSTFYTKNIYYFYTSLYSETSWLFLAYINTVAGWPNPVSSSDALTSYNTEINLAYYVIRNGIGLSAGYTYSYSPPPTFTLASSGYSIDVVIPSTGLQFFKSNSTYNVSIQFLDRFRRKCGVIKSAVANSIPVRTYNQTTFSSSLNWSLSNDDAINEIPDWAYYYSIVITKNNNFFVQIEGLNNKYVTKNTDGTFTYNATTWSANTYYAVAFDLKLLFTAGLGYTYNDGDVLILYKTDGTAVFLKVLEVDGTYVFASPVDIGDLTGGTTKNLIEIYTPYKPSASEPYYETPNVYPILEPATSGKLYSTLSGTLNGDCYAIKRNDGTSDYYVEAMSPNDRYWQNWFSDVGWVNYITSLGQSRHYQQFAYSETYIQGTQINGLSTFDALNVKSAPLDCGTIRKIILTSKVANEQGSVMVAIGELKWASLYLGEARLVDQTGSSQITAASSDVIGTINVLKGSFGTINPESAVEYRGDVFCLDMKNGRWIQYSINGLDVISSYKMEIFWQLWCAKFLSMTAAEIEALGGRPFVFTAVDGKHNELLISIPKLSNEPPKGYLPDYPATIYPFDILDYQGKTIVYKLGKAQVPPHFQGSYTFYSENLIALQNNLYSSRYGMTYQHNQTNNYCNFYGVQYTAKIMFVSNLFPNIPKVYKNTEIECNIAPSLYYLYNNYPYQQATDLVDFDFRNYEGIWKKTFYRNKLVPNATGYTTDGLLTAEEMRGATMYVMIEFSDVTQQLEFRFVNIGFTISEGHPNQISK